MQIKSSEPAEAPVERVRIKEWHGPSGFASVYRSRIRTVDADKVPPGAEIVTDTAVPEHDWQIEERENAVP